MNILFLTPQLPCPPWQGTTLRNFHLIEGLAERHHGNRETESLAHDRGPATRSAPKGCRLSERDACRSSASMVCRLCSKAGGFATASYRCA